MRKFLKGMGVPVIFGQLISKKKLNDPMAVSKAEKILECINCVSRGWLQSKEEVRELKEQMARVSHDNMVLRQTQDSHLAQIKDLNAKLDRKALELQENLNKSKKEAPVKP
jgi:hypothetical protein